MTIRPICYFDLRIENPPEWTKRLSSTNAGVQVVIDQAPAEGCTQLTGEMVSRGEDGFAVAKGRVLVLGLLDEIRVSPSR